MEYESWVNATGTRTEKGQLNSLWILKSIAQTKTVLVSLCQNKKELNNSQQINDRLRNFHQTLFKEKLSLLEECLQSFLDKVSLSKLTENQTLKCEGPLAESELLNA